MAQNDTLYFIIRFFGAVFQLTKGESTNIYTISVDQNGNWIVNPNGI